jgi:hypothetical protein
MGNDCGVYIRMMSPGTVPGIVWLAGLKGKVNAKLVTKPPLVDGTLDAGAWVVPKSWAFVLRYPSPGFAPGMKWG